MSPELIAIITAAVAIIGFCGACIATLPTCASAWRGLKGCSRGSLAGRRPHRARARHERRNLRCFRRRRALEAAGVEPRQAEAIASAIAAQTVTRADLGPLATKTDLNASIASMRAELGTIRWTVGLIAAFLFAIGLRVFGLI